ECLSWRGLANVRPADLPARPALREGSPMFQSAEHALAVAYRMSEQPMGPKSSTAIAIDTLRERYDQRFVARLPSDLTPQEWQAQAALTIKFAERLLEKKPLELAVIRAEFASGRDFVLGLAVLRDWLKPGGGSAEQRATLALLMRMFRRPPHGIREIERLS